jgi:hypothetical protein
MLQNVKDHLQVLALDVINFFLKNKMDLVTRFLNISAFLWFDSCVA